MTNKARGAFPKPKRQRINSQMLNAMLSVIPKECSIIDIGAGSGKYVKALKKRGYKIDGVDGIPDIENKTNGLIKWTDLSKEIIPQYEYNWDWGIFIEVGEHIPKEYESQVFSNVATMACKGLFVSWAAIGQRGYKHVNCHTQVYVASEFAQYGFFVDEEKTILARRCFADKPAVCEKIMVLRAS